MNPVSSGIQVKFWRKNKSGEVEILPTEHITPILQTLNQEDLEEECFMSYVDNAVFGIDYGFISSKDNLDAKKIEKVTATVLSEMCKNSKNTVMYISFRKKDGTNRILKGYHKDDTDSFGRFYFFDMEKEESDNIRLVDPRELNWIQFCNGNRFSSKDSK